MAEFLVEWFVSRTDLGAVERNAILAGQAAVQLSHEGASIRFVRSIYIAEDETCFHHYEARTLDAVRTATQRAAVPYERIIEAVTDPPCGAAV